MVGDGIVVGVTVWEGGFHKSLQRIISTDHFILRNTIREKEGKMEENKKTTE